MGEGAMKELLDIVQVDAARVTVYGCVFALFETLLALRLFR